MKKLKPCPFCGGDAYMIEHDMGVRNLYVVMCKTCDSMTATRFSREEAAGTWNRRTNEAD